MPVVSYTSLSESPPVVGVSCGSKSFTCALATKARAYSLCWLDARYVPAMGALATSSGSNTTDKLSDAGLAHSRGRKLDVPIVSRASAALECTLLRRSRYGDHVFLVGKVEAAYASSDFRDYWKFKDYKPVMYTGWRDGLTLYEPR